MPQNSRLYLGRKTPSGRPLQAALIALCLLGAICGASGTAVAQKAAVITALRSSENSWWLFMKKKIQDTGLYPDGVDQIDCGFRDPTLMQLVNYKLVVILSSDYGLSSSVGVGDALGDYMATVPGGAVLLFQPNTWQTGLFGAPAVGGKFLANFALTTQTATATTSSTKRGTIKQDPLTDGVALFGCGYNCSRLTGAVPKPGASVVAYWADGTILAVRGKRRVDLNMYPADNSAISGSWEPAGGDLITNAILYLSVPVLQSPRKLAFPSTGLGATTKPTLMTFRNISEQAVSVTGIGFDGVGKSQFAYAAAKIPSPAAPLTLAVGGTLKVNVQFKPQVQGTHKARLYLDLAGLPRIAGAVEGVTVGNLYISQSPIDFGGIPSGTTAGPVAVSVKNLGAVPIALNKPVLDDTSHFTLTTAVPDATVSMFPGATYNFSVGFNPAADTGDLSTAVTITSDDASSPLSIPVGALAGPPKAQLPYTSILLPDQPTGVSGLPLEITVSNTGYSDLKVSEISTDSGDFKVLNPPSTGSPLTIAAQQLSSFQLVFTPSKAGLRTGKLTLKSNAPPAMGMADSNQTMLLSGNGTTPQFKVDVTAVDFGTVDIGAAINPKTVNLINMGDGDLRVSDVSIATAMGSAAFAVSTADPVPFVLRAGATVPVTVSFAPSSAGMLMANLRVATDLAMGGSATIGLKGVANGAVGQLSPASLDFGTVKVKSKTVKSLVITNSGNKDLTIVHAALTPPAGVFSAMLPPDGTKVLAGKSLSIDITAWPSMAGLVTGRIDLQTDDPAVSGGTPFTAQLTVNGILPGLAVTPLTLAFMPTTVGKTSDMLTIQVENSGSVAIDNLAVAISASPAAMGDDSSSFSSVTGWKTMLLPGEKTQIGFTFSPRVAKNLLQATVVLTADGAQVPATVALSGSAMSAMLSLQPGELKFEPTVAGQTSQPKYVTLRNEGGQPIDIDILPPPSADFQFDLSQTKTTLGADETTRIAVTFGPQSPGLKSESLEIRLKGTTVKLASVDVDGSGVKPPVMTDGGGGCHAAALPHTHPRDFAPLATLLVLAALLVYRRRRSS